MPDETTQQPAWTSTIGTRTTVDGTLTTAQKLRIHVPTANAELVLGLSDDHHQGVRASTETSVLRSAELPGSVLGWRYVKKDEEAQSRASVALGVDRRGFVGVLGTTEHGNVMFVAGGAASLGASYDEIVKMGGVIEAAIGLTRAALLYTGATWNDANASTLQKAVQSVQLLVAASCTLSSPLGGAEEGVTNFDYLKTGHVSLFGARSVHTSAVETVTSSAALFASQNAGVSSSVSSVLVASVNAGAVASVNGGFAASLNGNTATVVGGYDASVSARTGTAHVEGVAIRIGSRWLASTKAELLSGVQERTRELWMRASQSIELSVPGHRDVEPLPSVGGFLGGTTRQPTGVQILNDSVRVAAGEASLRVSDAVSAIADKSVLLLGPEASVLSRVPVAPGKAAVTAIAAARTAYDLAFSAAEGVVDQIKRAFAPSWSGAAKVAAAAAAAGAAAGAHIGAEKLSGGAKVIAQTTAIMGGVGVGVLLARAAMKAAALAQRVAQRDAHILYLKATRAALAAERTAATLLPPTAPRVVVKDDSVTLVCGTSSIVLKPDSIAISAMEITANDMAIGLPMVPAPPPPPPQPPPPQAPSNDDDEPPNLAVLFDGAAPAE